MGIGGQRNKPCICGSGKKLKRCCLGKQANQIRYNHVHREDNPASVCLTCREIAQARLVKSALPAEDIKAEL